jgi:integrase
MRAEIRYFWTPFHAKIATDNKQLSEEVEVPRMSDYPLVPTPLDPEQTLATAGQIANQYAAQGAFADYLSRQSDNTLRAQAASLARFADYLNRIGEGVGQSFGADMTAFAAAVAAFPDGPVPDPDAWQGISWGLVEGFRNWMVQEGDAVSTINARLSAVKTYAKLAMKAGALTPEEYAVIRTVAGYSQKEAKRVNERREITRRGHKKAQHVSIDKRQARKLKKQPDTPQGRRDALMMCLLLDHGLRVGEVTRLQVSDFDLKAGEMRFYRPKVDKTQTHKLSGDTQRALQAWFESGDAHAVGPLLRASRKNGELTDAGMTEWAISQRVRTLGERIGLDGLSAHDCRHYWATFWADKVDVLRLQEAGGWSSLAMPRRYVEESEIANEGMA